MIVTIDTEIKYKTLSIRLAASFHSILFISLAPKSTGKAGIRNVGFLFFAAMRDNRVLIQGFPFFHFSLELRKASLKLFLHFISFYQFGGGPTMQQM